MRSIVLGALLCLLAATSAVAALNVAPGVPSNLAAATSGSSVTLTWTAPADGSPPTAYVIEAGSSAGLANLASFSTGNDATIFSTSDVGAGTYFVRVRAANAAGTGAASNEVTLTVGGGGCSAPGAPAGFTIVTNTSGTVGFTWIAAAGSPTTYIIEAGSSPGLTNLAMSDLGSAGTSFTTGGVGNGTYYVRLRAKNACGTSGPSNEVVLTVGAATPTGPVPRWGQACATQGQLQQFLLCDGGKWRYATYSDVPPAPAGGYTSRPSWYPVLTSVLGSQATCPAGGVQLTNSPLPVDQLTPLVPYGAMIYDHVTPIDHAYLNIQSLNKPANSRTESDYVPVTAAGNGVIIELGSLGSPTSNRVVIDHGCGIYTVYMVLNRVTGVLAQYSARVTNGEFIRPNIAVTAGTEFARQRDNPMDFNVFDQSVWLSGFANPFSYGAEPWKPYTADPTGYFTPSLASLFQSLSQRTAFPRWGKIDDDIAGTAQGSWFLDGTQGYSCVAVADALGATSEIGGSIPGKNSHSYCHLSLSPHWIQPTTRVASIGWWSNPTGDFIQAAIRLHSGQPTPDQVTSSTGVVVYELVTVTPDGSTPGGNAQVTGMLAVRMNPDDTLTVETLPGATSASAFGGFTSNQRKYHR